LPAANSRAEGLIGRLLDYEIIRSPSLRLLLGALSNKEHTADILCKRSSCRLRLSAIVSRAAQNIQTEVPTSASTSCSGNTHHSAANVEAVRLTFWQAEAAKKWAPAACDLRAWCSATRRGFKRAVGADLSRRSRPKV